MNNELLIHLGARMNISPKSIVMLKADINYTSVYLEDGSTFITATTIGILEDRLKNFCFFRPNRSVIINLDYMVEFEEASAQIKMENNETIKISRRKTKHFENLTIANY
jgi:DNA-binding LytR/AlgR family response regulator